MPGKSNDINFLEHLSIGEKISLGILKGFGYTFGYLTFLPWYFASGNYKKPYQNCKQVLTKETDDFPVYTLMKSVSNPSQKLSYTTVTELFNNSVEKNSDKSALGTRKLVSEEYATEKETDKKLRKVILSDYNWLTYKQFGEKVNSFAKSFLHSGRDLGTPVIIFGDTCADWLISALSLFKCSVPVATVYSSLADDAIVHSMNQTKSEVAICDKKAWLRLIKLSQNFDFLKTVILMSDCEDMQEKTSLEILHFNEFIEQAKNIDNIVFPKVDGDTLAMIMFTSGSTGQPKGVLILQSNMIAVVEAISHLVDKDSVCISYLPLAHILETALEIGMVCQGGRIGYGTPLTLTDRSPMIKEGSKGDLTALRPTIFTAVPLSLERIVKAILEKLSEEKRSKRLILQFCLEYKRHFWRKGFGTPLIDKLIFSKIAAVTGGNIKKAVVGGGPVSPETEEFVSICMNMNLMQGYGLTETCAAVSLKSIWDRKVGTTGAPVKNTALKLIPWEEGGYNPDDKPFPRGEITVSGPQVTSGYYKMPELTDESFKMINGIKWFLTGDIGSIDERGCLKIIDRRKDIVKLEHGEYVSLAKIETTIGKCSFVDNCCCIPVPQINAVFMLVVSNKKVIESFLEKINVHSMVVEKQFDNAYLIIELMKEVNTVSKKGSLNKFETPLGIILVEEIWMPDNGFLTPSMKLKRVEIKKFYKKIIDDYINNLAEEKNVKRLVISNEQAHS